MTTWLYKSTHCKFAYPIKLLAGFLNLRPERDREETWSTNANDKAWPSWHKLVSPVNITCALTRRSTKQTSVLKGVIYRYTDIHNQSISMTTVKNKHGICGGTCTVLHMAKTKEKGKHRQWGTCMNEKQILINMPVHMFS